MGRNRGAKLLVREHEPDRRRCRAGRAGKRVVVDVDLAKYFDRVNHDILIDRLRKRIDEAGVIRLVRAYLNAGIRDGGVAVERHLGTAQAGPLSLLLANVLLDEVDKALEVPGYGFALGHRRGLFAARADDCNVYVGSMKAGLRVMAQLYPDSHGLKLSNRPVPTRRPGGVAGVPPVMEAPICRVKQVCSGSGAGSTGGKAHYCQAQGHQPIGARFRHDIHRARPGDAVGVGAEVDTAFKAGRHGDIAGTCRQCESEAGTADHACEIVIADQTVDQRRRWIERWTVQEQEIIPGARYGADKSVAAAR